MRIGVGEPLVSFNASASASEVRTFMEERRFELSEPRVQKAQKLLAERTRRNQNLDNVLLGPPGAGAACG